MTFDPTLIPRILTSAAPVLLAALGGLFGERVGVVNISLEGMMLFGALTAVVVGVATGSSLVAALAAIGAGILAAALFGAFAIGLRRDQVIVGTTLNFLAIGLTGVWYQAWLNGPGSGKLAPSLPVLVQMTTTDANAGGLNAVTLLALALVPAGHYLLFRTRLGLTIRAAGEVPAAAAAAGSRVNLLRFAVVLGTGALCGLGGAALSVGITNSFTEGMTSGRGYVALAVVVFGRWNPLGVLGVALLFAALDIGQLTLQATGTWKALPYPVSLAIPYLLALLALAIRGARAKPPAALGIPFEQL